MLSNPRFSVSPANSATRYDNFRKEGDLPDDLKLLSADERKTRVLTDEEILTLVEFSPGIRQEFAAHWIQEGYLRTQHLRLLSTRVSKQPNAALRFCPALQRSTYRRYETAATTAENPSMWTARGQVRQRAPKEVADSRKSSTGQFKSAKSANSATTGPSRPRRRSVRALQP